MVLDRQSAQVTTNVIHDPVEIDSWLARWSLRPEDISIPLMIGRAAGADTTHNNPVSAAGYYRWSESYRAICELLCTEQRGWLRADVDGQPLVIHRGYGIALLVTSGTNETGDLIADEATNRNPKGRATRAAVTENQLILPFADALPPLRDRRFRDHGLVTWFLLYAIDNEGDIHAELSLPRSIGENGHVNSWATRLVFGRLNGDAPARIAAPEEPAAPVVEVARRSN
jgi:hypothetical protein